MGQSHSKLLVDVRQKAGAIEAAIRRGAGVAVGLAQLAQGKAPSALPRTTAIGALAYYVSHADPATYQPSNITHGIMEPLANPPRDKARKRALIAERALADLETWQNTHALLAR